VRNNTVQHQQFRVLSSEANFSRRVVSIRPMLKKVLRSPRVNSFCRRKGLYPCFDCGWNTLARAQRVIATIRRHRQRVDRHRIGVVKPKRDCSSQLAKPCRFNCRSKSRSRCFRIITHAGDVLLEITTRRSTLWQCRSETPAKKPCGKSKGLPNPSRLTARICSALTILSGSYAKLKSASHRSHRASKRSSNAEKFVSRFLARFTFFSVSVTRYAFLPSGGRPAPSRFPPCLGVFMLEKIYTNYVDAS
jgi:hypothetical protein